MFGTNTYIAGGNHGYLAEPSNTKKQNLRLDHYIGQVGQSQMEKLANREPVKHTKTPTVATSVMEKRSEKRVFPEKGSGRLTSLQKMKTPTLQSKEKGHLTNVSPPKLSYNYNEPGMMGFNQRVPNNLIGQNLLDANRKNA